MAENEITRKLLNSSEPSVRYHVRVNVLGEDPQSESIRRLREEVRTSPRVEALLSERGPSGEIPHGPYRKWRGGHWVLAVLADLGYPPGDEALLPLRDQVYGTWLSPKHVSGVPTIDGRPRRCASQEGNALWSTLTLGIADERADRLVENLLQWQWPDGGWNCDRKPKAVNSSFHETLIPLRALALYGRTRSSEEALDAARQAAEIFLKRRLFRRQRDGEVMNEKFLRLHYPHYWIYDILTGLNVMAEARFLDDPRCSEALDVLESKRLPSGGFPAEGKHYRAIDSRRAKAKPASHQSLVDWGGAGKRRMNEFVTVEALHVLTAAGRFRPAV